jgi:hypothetical protein
MFFSLLFVLIFLLYFSFSRSVLQNSFMEIEPVLVPIEEHNLDIPQQEADLESDGYDQLFQSTDFTRWRKNAPYLYNMLFYELLNCPSPTVQWLDQHTVKGDPKCDYYRLIIGTQGGRTPNDSRNELTGK